MALVRSGTNPRRKNIEIDDEYANNNPLSGEYSLTMEKKHMANNDMDEDSTESLDQREDCNEEKIDIKDTTPGEADQERPDDDQSLDEEME
eukprot:3592617-Ditylum_brightwellii.AAC.1